MILCLSEGKQAGRQGNQLTGEAAATLECRGEKEEAGGVQRNEWMGEDKQIRLAGWLVSGINMTIPLMIEMLVAPLPKLQIYHMQCTHIVADELQFLNAVRDSCSAVSHPLATILLHRCWP